MGQLTGDSAPNLENLVSLDLQAGKYRIVYPEGSLEKGEQEGRTGSPMTWAKYEVGQPWNERMNE